MTLDANTASLRAAAHDGYAAGVRAALGDHEPTAEQLAVISGSLGPQRVIAGAGSGKTAVMAARVVHLIEALGVRPATVLCLTFTNKAAGELEERVRRALAASAGAEQEDVRVHTYHAFAAELVAAYGLRIGIEPGADLLSEAQQYQIMLRILESERFEHLEVRTPGSTISKVLALASACADHLVTPDEVSAHAAALLAEENGGPRLPNWVHEEAQSRAELCRLVVRYAAEKHRRGRIDFGDQVAKAVELVERHEDIAAALRERYQHVLLDEYQDTNVAQRRLMQRICPAGASVLAVGDARQAIYGFRGATMYNLLEFPSQFPAGDGAPATSRSLSTSFRSARRILELANSVIAEIPEERRGGEPLVAAPANGEGAVSAALLADQFTEAAFVAERVAEARVSGVGGGQPLRWRDIAVLVRHKRLLGSLRDALEERGVPVEVVGISGLLEMPEIVELVCTLRALDDPGDNVAIARLLLGPRWRIGYRHLTRLARWAARSNRELREGLPGEDPDPGDVAFALAEALDHLGDVDGLDDEVRARLERFRGVYRDLRRHADGPLLDLVQVVGERTGLWEELDASDDPRAATARQNVGTFLDRVAAFAPVEGDPSLPAFLAYLDAVEDAAETVDAIQPAAADSVKLMTAHSAKGLEFEMVVVAGLAAGIAADGTPKEGIFPDVRVDNPLNAGVFPYELREDAANLPKFAGNNAAFRRELVGRVLEEERRLFYVALTRAKRALVLTAAWWYQGAERHAKGPGPFWKEAAAHPSVEVVRRDDEPSSSPLELRLRARRAWPPPARRPAEVADVLFPEGYAAAVESEQAEPGTMAGRVEPADERAFAAALQAQRHLLEAATPSPVGRSRQAPRLLSVSAVLEYARCPRAFYWSVVRPLPERPRTAARLGTVVHRMLERRARRLPALVELDDLDDGAAAATEPGVVSRAGRNFLGTRFAHMAPPEPEVAVVLRASGYVLRGRIDAVFHGDDGVELVDWKTGAATKAAAGGLDQLALYALALRDLGEIAPPCRVTYCYLGGEAPHEESRSLEAADLDRQRELLDAAVTGIAAGDYERACGQQWCAACRRRRELA